MKVLVTGGHGFLGGHLSPLLKEEGIPFVAPPRSRLDLLDEAAVDRLFKKDREITRVVHLAARVGGIGANLKRPADLAFLNLKMGLNLFHAAFRHGIQKLVNVGTVCSYPKFTPVPFREADLWNGYPEESNAPYGIAKKMLLVLSDAYRKQYGFNSINLMPVNLYGEGDNFDPESGHVIPALIRKMVEAREKGAAEISVWGTGRASREFLYAGDAARMIVRALRQYESGDPMNIGTGVETRIGDLVDLLSRLTGFQGKIVWDNSRPDGQARRCLDIRRMRENLGPYEFLPLEEGLRRTIRWYIRTRKGLRKILDGPEPERERETKQSHAGCDAA